MSLATLSLVLPALACFATGLLYSATVNSPLVHPSRLKRRHVDAHYLKRPKIVRNSAFPNLQSQLQPTSDFERFQAIFPNFPNITYSTMTSIASSTNDYSHIPDARDSRGTAVWKTCFWSKDGQRPKPEGVVFDALNLFADENGRGQSTFPSR
jgi:hypothetical protein